MKHTGFFRQDQAERLDALICQYKDWPKHGVLFRDISPLLRTGWALMFLVDAMVDFHRSRADEFTWVGDHKPPKKIAGIESRGFILGSTMAYKIPCGFVPVRKPGKTPGETVSKSYDLEYGSATLEIQVDAFKAGELVVIVDDLLATGGTAIAAVELIRSIGAKVVSVDVAIELEDLGGRKKLAEMGVDVNAALIYP